MRKTCLVKKHFDDIKDLIKKTIDCGGKLSAEDQLKLNELATLYQYADRDAVECATCDIKVCKFEKYRESWVTYEGYENLGQLIRECTTNKAVVFKWEERPPQSVHPSQILPGTYGSNQ